MIPTNNLKIELLNIVLNYIGSRGWTNYDNFAEEFTERIISSFQAEDYNWPKIISKTPNTFFRLNSITKKSFLTAGLIQKIESVWQREFILILNFNSIFPEINEISDEEASEFVDKIDIPEIKIQNALRKAFRSKGASPIPRRGKDSPLEIADIEHFRLKIAGKILTFAVVVKGSDSVKHVRLSWQDVAHQITRPFSATHPDYILLITAKEPKDGLVTALTRYGQDVGNPNLVIFVPPMDLAKFLKVFA